MRKGAGAMVVLPENVGDFRLMSRRVVDPVHQLRERHRTGPGHSKWSLWKLWNLALEGITSFTVAPLKLATYLGVAVALFAVVFGTRFADCCSVPAIPA